MASPTRHPRNRTPQYLRALFADWHARSGALSALPDAPVVPDEPAPRRLHAFWLRLRGVPARAAGRGRTADRRAVRERPSRASAAEWTAC